MNVSIQNHLRERVYNFLGQHSKKETVTHFVKENFARSTIYAIINRYKEGKQAIGVSKSGRPQTLTKTQLRSLKKAANERVGATSRVLARKFGVSKTTIRNDLINLGLKHYKRATVPKYTPKQLAEIPVKCRKLRKKFLKNDPVLILDDEKYFTFSWNKGLQNSGIYTKNISETPDEIRFAGKGKFEQKVLVWIAISVKGHSQLHIQSQRDPAINADNYIRKCLTKLEKFIERNHQGDDILFWPDNASAHYAKKTLEWYEMKNIKYVPKYANPPNIPKARPIEDYWALLCQEVYKNGWAAKTEQHLISRIKRSVSKVDFSVVQTMIRGVKTKIRKIEDHGPLVLYKN